MKTYLAVPLCLACGSSPEGEPPSGIESPDFETAADPVCWSSAPTFSVDTAFWEIVAWVNRNDTNLVFYDDVFVYDLITEVRVLTLSRPRTRPRA